MSSGYVGIINKTFFHILAAVMILRKRSKSVTLGCLQDTKWTIWNDKSIISNIDTLRTAWLQILPRVCLLRDRASLPYWNSRYNDLSQRLWLPRGIGCPDSGFELIERVLGFGNCKVVVCNQDKDETVEQRLVNDVLNILHVYTCRINGRRRRKPSNLIVAGVVICVFVVCVCFPLHQLQTY